MDEPNADLRGLAPPFDLPRRGYAVSTLAAGLAAVALPVTIPPYGSLSASGGSLRRAVCSSRVA